MYASMKNMPMIQTPKYSDLQIVNGILNNDQTITQHFFLKECKPLFEYIAHAIFDDNVEHNELVSELFLYLQHNDWHKVRQFDFRSKLTTWVSVVAVRFFQKVRMQMIETTPIDSLNNQESIYKNAVENDKTYMALYRAIQQMPNPRYKEAIIELELNQRKPEIVAKSMNITVDNLYNIRRRARLQLKTIMLKGGYYA